jgi:tetratricopeptide (TPR) repeat protein
VSPRGQTRPRSTLTIVTIFALCAAVQAAAPALAQAPSPSKADQAREHYQAGLRYYNLANYPPAIAEFKRAYELTGAPELLFNIGQAYRLGGDCGTAMRFYRNYLRETKELRNRAEVDAAVANCEQAEAAPPAAPAPPGAPPPERAAPPAVSPTPAGGARPGAPSAPRFPSAAPVSPGDAPAGSSTAPTAAELSATDSAPARPGRALRVSGLVAGGAGVALLTGGLLQGAYARKKAEQVDGALREMGGMWGRSLDEPDAAGRAAARRAAFLYGAGALGLVAGGTLYWLGHRAGAAAQLSLAPVPGGAAASVGGSF